MKFFHIYSQKQNYEQNIFMVNYKLHFHSMEFSSAIIILIVQIKLGVIVISGL